jgi:uncharacterized protein (DUF362 family)
MHMTTSRNPAVAIASDDDQKAAALAVLKLIRDDVTDRLTRWCVAGNKRQVLIKPNLLSTNPNPSCNTSVETCLGIAEFFKSLGDYTILVGDGTTYETNHEPSTMKSLENHGYDVYQDIWTLVDLHTDETGAWFDAVNNDDAGPVELGIAKLAIESFTVSVAKIKTHDVLGLTLCLKNMMGTLNAARIKADGTEISRGDVKGYMHGFGNHKPHDLTKEQNIGPSKVALAANLVRLASCRPPDLAVIDGSTVMEGPGPRRGNVCAEIGKFAMASTDFIAVDATCAAMTGFPLDSFQYVKRAGELGLGVHDLSRIEFRGSTWDSLKSGIKPHPLFSEASPWNDEEIEEFTKLT